MPATAETPRIRPFRTIDVPAWHALQADALPDPFSEDALRQELSHHLARHHGTFVDGALVACLLGWLVVDELQILQVVVAPGHRGVGLGRQLVRHAVRRARAAGAVTATLEVRDSNEAAIGLYRSCGFEVDGRRPGYYPDGEDAVLMRLAIQPRKLASPDPSG